MLYKDSFSKTRVLIPFFLQSVSWPIMRLLFGIFTRFEVKGKENLKGSKETGVIFAANHLSELDPILVTGALPWLGRFSPLFYVSLQKEEYDESGLMQHLYGGLFFKAWGAYPAFIGLKDYEKALINHINILNSCGSVCVFPEGKTTRTGQIGEGKGGVTYLSQKTQATIVPVGISGVFKMGFFDFLLRKRKIIVEFGKPILPEDLGSNEDYKKMSETVMEKIVELLPKHK